MPDYRFERQRGSRVAMVCSQRSGTEEEATPNFLIPMAQSTPRPSDTTRPDKDSAFLSFHQTNCRGFGLVVRFVYKSLQSLFEAVVA